MKRVLFFLTLIFFCACNGMPNNSNVSTNQNIDKPCSSEAVKNQVLSMFSISFVENGYSEDHLPIKFIKDSIDDIFSTPINNNTCKCEATIYYCFRAKDTWTPEQKNQDWYKNAITECANTYSHNGEIYHATMYDIINLHPTKHYPDDFGEIQFSKVNVTYEVKTSMMVKQWLNLLIIFSNYSKL